MKRNFTGQFATHSQFAVRLQPIAPRGTAARLLGGIVIALLLSSAHAATWYVDNAATGSNNGTSWANAWNSFTAIVWGASGVKAGDTLYISGGNTSKNYGTSTLTVGAAGVSGSPITISIGQDSGHNGTATWDFDSLGDSATTQSAIVCSRSYVTISGNVGGQPHILIQNLRNTLNNTTAYAVTNNGSATTGVIIEYIKTQNCGNPIRLTGSTGFTIRFCQLMGVRGDATISAAGSTGGFDASVIHNNTSEQLYNPTTPPSSSYAYGGPDGFQVGSGVTIRNNLFLVATTSLITSTQHPDSIQAQGNFIKIYANEFRNVGDSSIDFDCFSNPNTHDVWVYNNLFNIVTTIDPYPEFFRLYNTGSQALQSITNFKILNNTFVNSNFLTVFFKDFKGNPTSTGCEIKNNIFYNCGGGSTAPIITIAASTGYTASNWDTEGNIFYASSTRYISVAGTLSTTAQWVTANEPKGSTSAPTFVDAAAGNYRPAAGSLQIDRGVDLSAYFTTDKDGQPRSGAWDIGAYEGTASPVPGVTAPSNAKVTITVN